MGKFMVTVRTNGDFQFNLNAANGQSILTSQGYSSKAGCLNGIESVRKNSQDLSNFEKNKSTNDKFYFNLKAANGQIIGTSQMYVSQSGCDNGIDSVRQNAPDAEVIEK